ncbi:MAG TPA: DNA polymerase III subunit delta', partial [Vicinamibacterales bacterium]
TLNRTPNLNTNREGRTQKRERLVCCSVPFSDILGHRRLVSLLSRAVARHTLPPALLLAGPQGVGKRRTAVALAQALNCLKPVAARSAGAFDLDLDACSECASCRRIARGVHPDILILAPGDTGTIRTEEVREVIATAGYRPFEARRRVVIIDAADAMVGAAQNALLKTLEEPPSASVFVLVSSMPDALLPTVLSRCPRLRFGPLTPSEVEEVLIKYHRYSDADARAAAMEAEGSIGRALALQSVELIDARETARRLLEQTVRTTDPGRRIGVARDLAGKKGSPASERDQLASCLRALSSLLRDLGILASGGDARLLANADLQAVLRQLSTTFTSERSMRAFTAVDQALAALERNASPKVVADWLVLQL